jgi:hypothetical protein
MHIREQEKTDSQGQEREDVLYSRDMNPNLIDWVFGMRNGH